jgi:hypothetical protein
MSSSSQKILEIKFHWIDVVVAARNRIVRGGVKVKLNAFSTQA